MGDRESGGVDTILNCNVGVLGHVDSGKTSLGVLLVPQERPGERA